MKTLLRPLLLALIVSSACVLPSRVDATEGDVLEIEAAARGFVLRAVRAERLKDFATARAWYRASSAAYRFLVLPLRLAQIDYFHETGLLVPADFLLGGTGSAPSAVFAPEILDDSYVAAREKLEEYCQTRADVTLKRAQKLEIAHDILTPGLVPLEPAEPRAALETLVTDVVDVGVYRLLLAHRYDNVAAAFEKVSAPAAIQNIRARWQAQRDFVALATQAEYGARLTRQVGIAYSEAILKSIAQPIEPDDAAKYRKFVAALRSLLARQRQEATDAYSSAASALEANGNVAAAIVMRRRATQFLNRPEVAQSP